MQAPDWVSALGRWRVRAGIVPDLRRRVEGLVGFGVGVTSKIAGEGPAKSLHQAGGPRVRMKAGHGVG